MVSEKNLEGEMTNRLKINIQIIVLVVVAMAFSACDNNETYHQFQDIKESSWSKGDSLVFLVDTMSFVPGVEYNIDIETTNNSRFGYQNLWLFVRNNVSSDAIFQQDSIQLKLADEYGKWLGAGFGSFFQVSVPYKRKVKFSKKHPYTFVFVHGMRDEPLEGIEKVGLRISRSE